MLNAIIVDDEAPARSELRFLLDEVGGVEVTAEAANVREAIEKLKEYPCDVMFMDVNMPEATGLQLAEALQHLKFPPAVVFVTAYSEHALDAFKVSAIDYLVKPVETERLAQAIARVRATGEAVKLDAMNPFERKVCHDVVADEGLTSESEGAEPHRRVVILPEESDGE